MVSRRARRGPPSPRSNPKSLIGHADTNRVRGSFCGSLARRTRRPPVYSARTLFAFSSSTIPSAAFGKGSEHERARWFLAEHAGAAESTAQPRYPAMRRKMVRRSPRCACAPLTGTPVPAEAGWRVSASGTTPGHRPLRRPARPATSAPPRPCAAQDRIRAQPVA